VLPAGGATPDSLSIYGELGAPKGDVCRVFISHSGKQKRNFVDFLFAEFNKLHPMMNVFLDEYALKAGGDALPAIHRALGDAFVGACSSVVCLYCWQRCIRDCSQLLPP
jgi:hypothetical protein